MFIYLFNRQAKCQKYSARQKKGKHASHCLPEANVFQSGFCFEA